jgi:molybdenum cofactor biosynthesis protein B
MTRIDETAQFLPVRIAVLTVSDTRTLADDKSGDTTLAARITGKDTFTTRLILPMNAACTDQLRNGAAT